MNRFHCYVAFVVGAVGAMATWLATDRPAESSPNEFRYAACVENLNCGNCLLGWTDNAECSSGIA